MKHSSEEISQPELLAAEDAGHRRQLQVAAERKVRRDCEDAYAEVANLMGEVLAKVRDGLLTDDVQIELAVEKILALLEDFDAPLVLENMQLTRQNSDYYQYHAVNVALLGVMVGRLMNLSVPDMERLAETGLVMDFGMLRLGGNIGDRSARLTEGERVRIRQHMLATRQILEEAGATDAMVVDAVINHHERYNGGGYLRGLKGDDIPLLARIISVADSFDAALSHTRYKARRSVFQAMMELELNPQDALDPDITAIAIKGLTEMLVGCFVVLNDRSIGKIVQMDNATFPVVVVVGRRVQTGPNLYPVALSRYLPMTY